MPHFHTAQDQFDHWLKEIVSHATDNIIVYARDESHHNVRVKVKWPAYKQFDGSITSDIDMTRDLIAKVMEIRNAGYDNYIWMDHTAEAIVVVFDNPNDAMVFKLAYGGE